MPIYLLKPQKNAMNIIMNVHEFILKILMVIQYITQCLISSYERLIETNKKWFKIKRNFKTELQLRPFKCPHICVIDIEITKIISISASVETL